MKKETPYADICWIPDFQGKYAVWFREVKALLDAHQYPAAFKTYPFPAFEQTPWAPVRTPLAKGCLGIVSTADFYCHNGQYPRTNGASSATTLGVCPFPAGGYVRRTGKRQ